MITTLTPNPSLDIEYQVDHLLEGELHRASYFGMRAGGKGVNVSRVLTRMNVANIAVVPLDISSSQIFMESAKSDGIELEIVDVAGALRFNTTILHEGSTTKINAAGRPWAPKEAKRISDTFLVNSKRSQFSVVGGALPPSSPSGWLHDLVKEAGSRTRIVVDASGPALREAVAARPFMIKPNRDEAEELLGRSILDAVDAADAAQEIISMGAQNVLLSLGSGGGIFASQDGVLFAKPAELNVRNTVGAGDALLAGFIGAFELGATRALATATAWAEATITNQNMHLNMAVQEATIQRIIEEKRIVALPNSRGSKV